MNERQQASKYRDEEGKGRTARSGRGISAWNSETDGEQGKDDDSSSWLTLCNKKKQIKMILSGTPIATIQRTPPISINSTVNDGSANSAVLGELLISSNIHIPHRPVVTIRNLSAAATPAVTIPALIAGATEESNFTTTNLILNGSAPSAFRPIIPSTSSDSFVVTTLNSLISPSDHENDSSDKSHHDHHYHHYHHYHHHHHQQQQHQNSATFNGDYKLMLAVLLGDFKELLVKANLICTGPISGKRKEIGKRKKGNRLNELWLYFFLSTYYIPEEVNWGAGNSDNNKAVEVKTFLQKRCAATIINKINLKQPPQRVTTTCAKSAAIERPVSITVFLLARAGFFAAPFSKKFNIAHVRRASNVLLPGIIVIDVNIVGYKNVLEWECQEKNGTIIWVILCEHSKCIYWEARLKRRKGSVRFGRVPKHEKVRIAEELARVTARTVTDAIQSALINSDSVLESCFTGFLRLINSVKKLLDKPPTPTQTICPVGRANAHHAIKAAYDFSQSIPGFNMLHHQDRVQLLKGTLFQTIVLAMLSSFNSNKTLLMFQSPVGQYVHQYFYSPLNVALIGAAGMCISDKPLLHHPELAAFIHNRLSDLFQETFSEECRAAAPQLLHTVLCELRMQNAVHQQSLEAITIWPTTCCSSSSSVASNSDDSTNSNTVKTGLSDSASRNIETELLVLENCGLIQGQQQPEEPLQELISPLSVENRPHDDVQKDKPDQNNPESLQFSSSTLSRVQPSIVETHRSVASLLNQPPILPIAIAAIRNTFAQNCQLPTPMLQNTSLYMKASDEVESVNEEPLDLSIKR
ncbi:Nuclear receptor [Dirofilaria immitis]|nr:Nuclear receptor [Dirofilaria immitis]